MKGVVILAFVALVILACMPTVTVDGASPVSPLDSPIARPTPPPGFEVWENCPPECCRYRIEDGKRILWCDEECAKPTPTPAPTSCNQVGWWELPDWMGRYPLWTDGASYCVEGAR